MNKIVLTLDIGNTNMAVGVFDYTTLLGTAKFPLGATTTPDEIEMLLAGFLKKYNMLPPQVKGYMLCSVVPAMTARVEKACRQLCDAPIYELGRDVIAQVKNTYDNPAQVGQDRLANAVAVIKLYRVPAIVIDFGTAITIDVVRGENEYAGGLIVPGIGMSLRNLANETALLPEIEFDAPEHLIAKNTSDSLRSGVVYGFAALCDGVTAKISAELGVKPAVIATGGDAALMQRYAPGIEHVDEELTLKGLMYAYQDARSKMKDG